MKVLSSLAVIVAPQYAINIQEAEEILGGLLYGLIQKDDLSKIELCLKDADVVEQEINEAVEDFMKGDVTDILAGVTVIGKLIQELPVDLKDCQGMESDIARIEKWGEIFTDPTQLMQTVVQNLLTNYGAIFGDITKTSGDIAKADYYTAGEDIADVLVLTLGAVPQLDTLEVTQW